MIIKNIYVVRLLKRKRPTIPGESGKFTTRTGGVICFNVHWRRVYQPCKIVSMSIFMGKRMMYGAVFWLRIKLHQVGVAMDAFSDDVQAV